MGCKYRVMDKCRLDDNNENAFCFGKDDCPYYEEEAEVIPKNKYESRLKADIVAILTEIQLEIEELQGKYSPYYDEASQHISEVIQEKIDALKRGQE